MLFPSAYFAIVAGIGVYVYTCIKNGLNSPEYRMYMYTHNHGDSKNKEDEVQLNMEEAA